MFNAKKVRALEEEVAHLKRSVAFYRDDEDYYSREWQRCRTAFTSSHGGYWLFTDSKMGLGADRFVKVFGTVLAAERWVENVKPGQYNTLNHPTWAQIAVFFDGRLVVLKEMVCMPTRPQMRVWINTEGEIQERARNAVVTAEE